MISLEKWMILAPLQKLPNNVGNLGKIIVATGFELLPKVQKIAQSGHTAYSLGLRSTVSAQQILCMVSVLDYHLVADDNFNI